MNVSYNVSKTALKQFTDLCRSSRKKCAELKKKEGNIFVDELLGKDRLKQEFSFPNLLDLGLDKGKSVAPTANKQRAKPKRKTPIQLDKDKKEKLVQTYGHSMYLKQKV